MPSLALAQKRFVFHARMSPRISLYLPFPTGRLCWTCHSTSLTRCNHSFGIDTFKGGGGVFHCRDDKLLFNATKQNTHITVPESSHMLRSRAYDSRLAEKIRLSRDVGSSRPRVRSVSRNNSYCTRRALESYTGNTSGPRHGIIRALQTRQFDVVWI